MAVIKRSCKSWRSEISSGRGQGSCTKVNISTSSSSLYVSNSEKRTTRLRLSSSRQRFRATWNNQLLNGLFVFNVEAKCTTEEKPVAKYHNSDHNLAEY